MKLTKLLIMSALLALPGTTAAQTSDPSAAAKTRTSAAGGANAQRGAPAAPQESQAAGRIEAALSAAAEANVPVSLLESKVAEGRAKGVPEARIASAVEARLQALMRAGEVMRKAGEEKAEPGELAVAADAIQAGVTQDALIQITREAPADRRAVAVATLSQLVQLGLGSEQALLRVGGALSHGGEALANLRAEAAASLRVKGGGVEVKLP